jgi:TonB family protein
MKRFFLISLFLHGAVILLLFSWEIPLANRILPYPIIQVSLVSETPVKPEAAKPVEIQKSKPKIKAPSLPLAPEQKNEERKEAEKKKEEETRVAARQETAPIQDLKKEETVSKPDKNISPNESFSENPPRRLEAVEKVNLINQYSQGNPFTPQTPNPADKNSPAKQISGSAYLASPDPAEGKKGGSESQSIGENKDGSSLRMSYVPPSSAGLDAILGQIIQKIEAAKRYPRVARRMGIQGTTTIRFKLKSNGQVETAEIVESSGSEILDQASLETVRAAAPLPYKDGWLKVGIVFKIL